MPLAKELVIASHSHLNPSDPQKSLAKQGNTETTIFPHGEEGLSEILFEFKTSPLLEQKVFCRKPSLYDCTVAANRMLKFANPLKRNVEVYEKFILKILHEPKFSKKHLASLPEAVLESIFRQGMLSRFQKSPITHKSADISKVLCLWNFTEELDLYHLEKWVLQDIQQMNQRNFGDLPGFYFEGDLSPETLKTLLTRHGYTSQYVSEKQTQHQNILGYLIGRFLTHTLPWELILNGFPPPTSQKGEGQEPQGVSDTPSLKEFPYLQRLLKIHLYLEQSNQYQPLAALMETNLFEAIETIQKLIASPQNPDFLVQGVTRPVRRVLIVEGATEELLLPQFAKHLGIDFNQHGILIHPAGGKNQVLPLYLKYSDSLNIPMTLLLDQDAQSVYENLKEHLRPQDQFFILAEGEFEDTYDIDLILKTVNQHYHPHPKLTRELLNAPLPQATSSNQGTSPQSAFSPADAAITCPPLGMVARLKSIWRHFQLGDFDKIEFAHKIAEATQDNGFKVPAPLAHIITALVSKN
ncbi:MAG: hypothetical protein K2X66_03180 [Cyanobacteria bacterium]|nr:hypothetical protein [Cyanobacteriota bacterium]